MYVYLLCGLRFHVAAVDIDMLIKWLGQTNTSYKVDYGKNCLIRMRHSQLLRYICISICVTGSVCLCLCGEICRFFVV